MTASTWATASLKVDGFINHQVDPTLMLAAGGALAARFAHLQPNKVFTAEISGIAPAFTTALALGVPVLYARKAQPVTMHPQRDHRIGSPATQKAKSPT